MATSPRIAGSNPEGQRREEEYARSFISLSPAQLLGRITLSEAQLIDETADKVRNTDVLGVDVGAKALTLRMNAELYDDDAEDFIFESAALGELIGLNRSIGTHETGEAVRFVRSARAAIYFYHQDIEPELEETEPVEETPQESENSTEPTNGQAA